MSGGRLYGLTLSAIILLVPLRVVLNAGPAWDHYAGVDYDLYIGAARHWLETGSFYLPHQFAPYHITPGDILYPPNSLYLFVPFVWLPSWLWWAVPLGVVAWTVWRHRPHPLAWPFIALCLAWPPTALTLLVGNPVIWVAAFVALGTLYGWPAVLAFLKPAVFPFAMIGIWDRRWWLALAVFGLAALPFGAMWFDWLAVLRNSDGGLLYSIQQVPLLLIPVIAWLSHLELENVPSRPRVAVAAARAAVPARTARPTGTARHVDGS